MHKRIIRNENHSDKLSKLTRLYIDALTESDDISKGKDTLKWTPMGPFTSIAGIGRVNCITFSPNDTNTLYIGAPSGGFWKSYDHGKTWETTTDAISSIGVSGISIPNDSPNVIYISTGDKDLWDSRSIGILKSIDGGNTWDTTGLIFNISTENRICGKVIINQQHQNILHVYSNTYYYKSLNSGNTFSTKNFNEEITSLIMHPLNPEILYMGTINGKLFRTIDGGENWTEITSNIGYASVNNRQRLTLTVNPTIPNAIYVLSQGVADLDENSGVYVSKNLGYSFLKLGSNGFNHWYGYTIAASSTDTNLIVVGGTYLFRTFNFGNTWNLAHTASTGFYDTSYLHVDIHDIQIRNNKIYVGNDGGIASTPQNESNWKNLNGNLALSQLYGFSSDEKHLSNMLIGSQDIGCGTLKNNAYKILTGGDGMKPIYDKVNSNTFYLSSQNGNFYKTTNGGNSFNYNFFGYNKTNEWGAWTTPIIVSKYGDDTLYIPHENLYKTTNKGISWVNLTKFQSPIDAPIKYINIPDSDPNKIYILREWGYDFFKSIDKGANWQKLNKPKNIGIYNFAVSSSNSNRIFAITVGLIDSNKVFQSNDGGFTWTNISYNLPNIYIHSIVYHNNTKDRVFVGTEMGVYYKDSTMNEWVKFGTGLPNTKINELEIHKLSNNLRAATYGRGIWQISLNAFDSLVASNNIKEKNIVESPKIHPIPASDKITIEILPVDYQSIRFSIYDMKGKLIKFGEANIENNKVCIDLKELNEGSFILVLPEINFKEKFIKAID